MIAAHSPLVASVQLVTQSANLADTLIYSDLLLATTCDGSGFFSLGRTKAQQLVQPGGDNIKLFA